MKTMHHIEEGNTYWLYDHTENKWVGWFANKKALYRYRDQIQLNQNLTGYEKELKKQVMSIVTDSKALEEPKDPATDNVFRLFGLLAPAEAVSAMRERYLQGGYGYGHAKQELLGLLLERYAAERSAYQALLADASELDRQLAIGAAKARQVAARTLGRIRERCGYGAKN